MVDITMFGTPGHPVPGVTALCGNHEDKSGYGRALVRERGFQAFSAVTTDSCRSVRKRSP